MVSAPAGPSGPIRTKDGYTFNRKAPEDAGAWCQGFLSWAGFDWVPAPLFDPDKPTFKWILRAVDDRLYDLPQLIDLVVAFPFVLFLQAMCATALKWNDLRRLAPFAFGLATVLVWLWALRFWPHLFWYSPAIPICGDCL